MADINAKSTLWHSAYTDDKGAEVELMFAEADVEVMNVPGDVPAFRGRVRASSNIDITLANQHIVEKISE